MVGFGSAGRSQRESIESSKTSKWADGLCGSLRSSSAQCEYIFFPKRSSASPSAGKFCLRTRITSESASSISGIFGHMVAHESSGIRIRANRTWHSKLSTRKKMASPARSRWKIARQSGDLHCQTVKTSGFEGCPQGRFRKCCAVLKEWDQFDPDSKPSLQALRLHRLTLSI